jgi:hypothetical protein
VPAPDFSRGSGFLDPRERSVGKLRALALVAALRHGYASYRTDTEGCSFIPTGRLALATELRLSIRIQSPPYAQYALYAIASVDSQWTTEEGTKTLTTHTRLTRVFSGRLFDRKSS